MKCKLFAVIALTVLSSSCIPFMSDEQNTSLWMSKEKRMESFKREQNLYLGREFYSEVPESAWCKNNECLKLEDSTMEYIEGPFRKLNECIVAWRVDPKQSTGNYQYRSGPVYYGLGKRLSWRYISRPEDCLTTLRFWGPW